MTPCEKLGYKVGDKFEVVEPRRELKKGDIVTLVRDDNDDSPMFIHENIEGKICLKLHRIKPAAPKLTKSKQWLADAIHNSGKGWPNGAQWAVQGGETGVIRFCSGDKPKRNGTGWNSSNNTFNEFTKIECMKPQPNWHQTVLSRDEYFSVYPEVEQSAPVCESVERTIPMQPTLDTLMQHWQDAKTATQQAQQAEREAHDAVTAELKRCGWGESESLEITDWRDLRVGDVIWTSGDMDHGPGNYEILSLENTDYTGQYPIEIEPCWFSIECTQWKFIRRP